MAIELLILLLSLILDRVIGEMPSKIHPVVWIGKLIEIIDSKTTRRYGLIGILNGGLLSGLIIGLFILPVFLISHLEMRGGFIDRIAVIALSVFFLKSTFSLKSLDAHALDVFNTGIKKEKVQMMVSRDVSNLDRPHLISAVIESLGDNIVDGFISPLFYYLLLGLPGALAFRAINTLDAMVGYKTPKFRDFGKIPARLDDILNFIPSRISIPFFMAVKPLCIKTVARFRHVKLNGGYPISAMAGCLGITLEKIGHYRIIAGREPVDQDIIRGVWTVRKVSMFYAIVILILMWQIGGPVFR
jgi:adenosylcobinamide-phosphate synthase